MTSVTRESGSGPVAFLRVERAYLLVNKLEKFRKAVNFLWRKERDGREDKDVIIQSVANAEVKIIIGGIECFSSY